MINRLLGLPVNASEHGAQIDHMLEVVHWFMLALFVFWGAFFAYCLIRFNRRANPRANYHGLRSHFSTHAEISVVIVEAFLLIAFAFPLWAARVNEMPSDSDAVVVRVIAQQFGWNFHYPGKDGKFGRQDPALIDAQNPIGLDRNDPDAKDDLLSINEMHLPANRQAVVHISSRDVIHNFALPHMRIAQDAIPGTSVPIWFKPIREGEYEVVCGQLCGSGHYSMKAWLYVDPAEDYQAWLDGVAARQLAPEGGEPAPGAPAPPAGS